MFKFMERAKMYAALVGSLLAAGMGSTGFAVVPEEARPYVALALALLTALATFKIPNSAARSESGGDIE